MNKVVSIQSAYALLQAGNFTEAMHQFSGLLNRNPDSARILEGLGRAAYQSGDLKTAEKAFRRLAELDSSQGPKGLLGVVLLEMGHAEASEEVLSAALKMGAENPVLLMNYGNALRALGREEDAAQKYREALERAPDLVEAALNLGDLLHGQGLWREADEAWARAAEIRPDGAMVRWKRLFAPLPTLAESEEEIEHCRAEFRRRLQTFADHLPQDFNLNTVGFAQPFLLAYQGRDDAVLMRMYGALVETAAQRSLPQYRIPLFRPFRRNERMRVGFVSAFFCNHSIWKIPLRGWVEDLDRSKFEVFCYCLGTRTDQITQMAEQACEHFRRGPKSVSKWAESISRDELHALIYPEIGMDALTIQLASLRLAPLQAVGLGHPQTTGLSTMDVMLSADLMQPEKSTETYMETLMPLPGIGVAYKPRSSNPHAVSRKELQVENDAVLFWCCHYISKYEPRHDVLYPSIAARLPMARFLFLGPIRGTAGFHILHRRLSAAFAALGMKADQYIRLLPRLETDRFDAVGRSCDLFLDNPGWSGFNSALECLALGLPVLTCGGGTVRANHAAAVLRRIGMSEFVARDINGLADMAVYFGRDSVARRALSERIAAGLPLLYEDRTPVRALEEWLLQLGN